MATHHHTITKPAEVRQAHLNPVKAAILDHLADYAFSSKAHIRKALSSFDAVTVNNAVEYLASAGYIKVTPPCFPSRGKRYSLPTQ